MPAVSFARRVWLLSSRSGVVSIDIITHDTAVITDGSAVVADSVNFHFAPSVGEIEVAMHINARAYRFK